MFNLYTYEKRIRDIELQEKQRTDRKQQYELHIKNRDKLAEKFYKKTNNFILEIIRKPIIVKNSYYDDEKEKKQNNSFCLYKFQTDKERIEKLINPENRFRNGKNKKEKTSIKQLNRCRSNIIIKKNSPNFIDLNDLNKDNTPYNVIYINDNRKIEGDKINQPSMKFKPRNDLERIIDSINMNKGIYIKNNEFIKFNNKYKKEKLIASNKENEKKEKDLCFIPNKDNKAILISYGSETQNKANNNKKIDTLLKQEDNKVLKDKINLSNAVKNITEKYHSKTYFNSIKQAILFNNNQDKKIFNKFNKINKKCQKKINYSSSAINFFPKINNNDTLNLKNIYKIKSGKKINEQKKKKNKIFKKTQLIDNIINDISLDLIIDDKDKINVLDKIFKLNNPISNYDIDLDLDNLNKIQNENLMKLKNMATNKSTHKMPFFSERRKSKSNIENKKGFFLDHDFSSSISKMKSLKLKNKEAIIEDDKYIIINNNVYNKKNESDMKNLGKIALKNCHFINTKFDDNEKNHLKKGEGKLMITNGLSLNQFLDKYSLPTFRK